MEDEGASWRLKAKCLGLDPNLFVPSKPGGSLKRVLAVCNGTNSKNPPCLVRQECDKFAIDNGLVGVFGGRMHSQRTTMTAVMVEIQDSRPGVKPPE